MTVIKACVAALESYQVGDTTGMRSPSIVLNTVYLFIYFLTKKKAFNSRKCHY